MFPQWSPKLMQWQCLICEGTWESTKITKRRFNLNYWCQVPNLLLIQFTRNNKTQPSSVSSERSKTINTAPQMSILSCIRTVWAQVSHVGLGTASCTLLEQRSHLSYGKPLLYLYLYTYIFLYLTYDGTWHNTKVLQMKCNMNHWSDLVPSLLLLHFTNNNKT